MRTGRPRPAARRGARGRFAEELPDGVDYLDRESRSALVGIMRVMLKSQDPRVFVSHQSTDADRVSIDAMGRD